MAKVTRKSMLSGKTHTMDIPVSEEELEDYYNSFARIQDIFPHLTDNQREFIMTGSTPEEWDQVFGEEE